ncbi:hypothetical protein CL6EHI_065220 [Entamoeba histolytica]|uniref:Uncharacterized protein n=3 Tax=Entamoeba histolytica TaxID=5759 RepID=C4M6K1_ENTH1|nr:hypothetical protein EHI_065220 [Entamoeba histolytica HM-1:IMSS]EAL47018.1 hypothetical protein EHI_065220 [Entamoeba histolytica HM-1:IMSS]EMD42941.1 Hypothetical protein EHI5A_077990 [Entamoeba histolytica KU27]GAT97118.1 hypothetical protein CL6EHI_065220 [Entamoeba histolytica]|eukprot:XP_652406.1 hypothetical protein EHI_065220 [Entamoeba histolytica HM-1:IMSS]
MNYNNGTSKTTPTKRNGNTQNHPTNDVIDKKCLTLAKAINQLIRDRNILVKIAKRHESVATQFEAMIARHQTIENEKITFLQNQIHGLNKQLQSIQVMLGELNKTNKEITPNATIILKQCGVSSPLYAGRNVNDLSTIKQYVYHDLTKCVARLHVCFKKRKI